MKQLVLVLTLILPLGIIAQTITAFNDSSSVWYVAETSQFQSPGFISTKLLEYTISGDTIYAGGQWQRIQKHDHYTGSILHEGYVTHVGPLGLHLTNTNQLDTIYDYSIQMGDTVVLPSPYSVTHTVVDIDSIMLLGVPHNRIWFDTVWVTLESYTTDVWIEGVGSIFGPLAPHYPAFLETDHFGFIDSTRLTCYSMQDSVVYRNPNYAQCDMNIIQAVQNIQQGMNLTVHPNPGNDHFTIDLPEHFVHGQLLIRDLEGRVVVSNNVYSGHRVNTGALGSGTYVVELSDSTGKRWLSRWVKR